MIEMDFSRCKTKPDPEQREGIKALIRYPYFAIFDTMGWIGKTKQVIDAACFLFEAGEIDTVLVACPAQVKINWSDSDLGQIKEHAFVLSVVHEITAQRPRIPEPGDELVWAIVSYEWGRNNRELISEQLIGRKVMIVGDESIKLATHSTDTTKAFTRLRDERAQRAVILNGTPGDMVKAYSQYRFLSKTFWPYENFFHYRAHFCVMGGPRIGGQYRKVVAFKHKEEFDTLTVPYTLRREKPPNTPNKYYSLSSCTLSPATWKIYKQMRQEMIAWLDREDVREASVANQAVTRGLRLAQITSGFLGGVEDLESNTIECREIGDEKTTALIRWIEDKQEERPEIRLIVWCRFRPEIFRLCDRLNAAKQKVVQIVGGQSKATRREAVGEFMKGSGSCILIGQQQAGGLGLNLVTADEEIFISNDQNVITRSQAEDRAFRRGRTKDLHITDLVAIGPDGQKTIDHAILKSLRDGVSLHQWTAANWRKVLQD